MNRRWISLILILAMLFSLTVPAFAETPAATSGSVVNPLYVNYPAPDDNDAAGRRLARSASAWYAAVRMRSSSCLCMPMPVSCTSMQRLNASSPCLSG